MATPAQQRTSFAMFFLSATPSFRSRLIADVCKFYIPVKLINNR
ncbi:hypothetical protein SynA18461_01055 [Synechococcus sp. A18-46.1]|nr:hypothetical protein SynA18461_01055 [Synechococcus sp. A18-46.1]